MPELLVVVVVAAVDPPTVALRVVLPTGRMSFPLLVDTVVALPLRIPVGATGAPLALPDEPTVIHGPLGVMPDPVPPVTPLPARSAYRLPATALAAIPFALLPFVAAAAAAAAAATLRFPSSSSFKI